MAEERDNQVFDGKEWTAEHALADIIGAIDNPEDYSEKITALTNAVNTDTSDQWRTRYETLREDYRRRFLDDMRQDVKPDEKELKTAATDTRREITVEDLDFSGLTE